MRAMVLDGPGQPLRLAELPCPVPQAGQLLLAVQACGVCRTDLHLRDGELPDAVWPLVPGHEIVARVAGLGPGVRGWPAGTAGRRSLAGVDLWALPVLHQWAREPVRAGVWGRRMVQCGRREGGSQWQADCVGFWVF